MKKLPALEYLVVSALAFLNLLLFISFETFRFDERIIIWIASSAILVAPTLVFKSETRTIFPTSRYFWFSILSLPILTILALQYAEVISFDNYAWYSYNIFSFYSINSSYCETIALLLPAYILALALEAYMRPANTPKKLASSIRFIVFVALLSITIRALFIELIRLNFSFEFYIIFLSLTTIYLIFLWLLSTFEAVHPKYPLLAKSVPLNLQVTSAILALFFILHTSVFLKPLNINAEMDLTTLFFHLILLSPYLFLIILTLTKGKLQLAKFSSRTIHLTVILPPFFIFIVLLLGMGSLISYCDGLDFICFAFLSTTINLAPKFLVLTLVLNDLMRSLILNSKQTSSR